MSISYSNDRGWKGTSGSKVCRAALLFFSLSLAGTSSAQGAGQAGTTISNVARLQVGGAGDRAIESNRVDLTVGEVLDVALTRTGEPVAGDSVAVTVENRGNGAERFAITASGRTVRLVAHDVDGDGRFDTARDVVLADGRTPVLASGARLALLVAFEPEATPGVATIVATAATGSGAPGTVFAGQGDGGGDAVVGVSHAAARLEIAAPVADPDAPTLAKTQSVAGAAVRGAVITYSLAARFTAPTTAARVHDAIPAGTAYVPGSLRLDAIAISDAADGDAGGFDGGAIDVTLGDIAAPVTRTVQFQVRIQ